MKPNPAKLILWLAGIALLVAVMFLTPSCTSTKQVNKEHRTVDSTAVEEKVREIMRLQADTAEYRRQIREMEYLGVSFTDCPEVDTSWFRKLFSKDCPPDRVDSFIRVITPPPTTVRKGADGSLEIVSNRIAGVIQSNIRLVEEAASLRSRLLQLEKDSARLVAQVKKSESLTKKDVKRSFGPAGLMLGLVVGLIIGFWVRTLFDQ